MKQYFVEEHIGSGFVADGKLFVMKLATTDVDRPEEVHLCIDPKAVHLLALLLLERLSDATSRGIVPPSLRPILQVQGEPVPAATGVRMDYALTDGLCIESELPWSDARKLADHLTRLCDEHDEQPSKPN